MGRNFAYKEPLEAGVVAPLGPLGGKANTQLFAGDRENQWVSSAKAAMGRFPHWVILLSLKWWLGASKPCIVQGLTIYISFKKSLTSNFSSHNFVVSK